MYDGMRDKRRELYYDLTNTIIKGFWEVVSDLKPGLHESLYQRALPIALGDLGLSCQTEAPFTVDFRGRIVGAYRADLIVENKVIVETKAVAQIRLVHEEQILNYMNISNMAIGLLLNFGPKPTVRRYALRR